MKKIIAIGFLFACLLTGDVQAGNVATQGLFKAIGCNPATNQIGDRTTTYTASINSSQDDAICVYAIANCSGTLGYAYVVHYGVSDPADNAEISVYQDNGATATTPDSTDDILSGMTARQISSGTDGEVVQTAAKLGGSVVNGQGYFICIGGDSTVWATEYESTGTTRRFSFTGNQFPYGTPPANLSTADASDTTASVAVYVEIE